jgi:HSP20 family molecular chaperone IbpA
MNLESLQREHLLFDVQETPSHYFLRLDVHSVPGSEIILDISGETLTLRGEGDPCDRGAAKRISLRVDSGHPAASASFRSGILIIALPKIAPPLADGYEKRPPAPRDFRR